MVLVETKTYKIDIADAEREQFKKTADFLRSIEREIDNVIGTDYDIEVGGDVFSGMDLWRAAELLDGIALGNYEI